MKKRTLAWLSLAVLGVSIQANAATITQTVGNVDWNAAMWGTPAAAPTASNDYVTATVGNDLLRLSADGSSSTFGGDSLTVVTNTRALMKNAEGTTATINGNFIMDGGRLSLGVTSSATLSATEFNITAKGAWVDQPTNGKTLTIDAILTGVGNLLIDCEGIASSTQIISFGSVGSYTGDITVNEGMGLDFGEDHIFAGGLALTAASHLNVDQTLSFEVGKLTVDGIAIAGGTYTGASLDALGTNFNNSGGTLIIGSGALPPAVPVNLAATAVGSQIDLSWDANTSDTNFASYVLYRSTTDGGPYVELSADLTTNAYSDLDLPTATFHYVVTAVNDEGAESAYSAQASASVSFDIGISIDGTTMTITLPGEAGREYHIDYRDDLTTSGWTLYSTHTGSGSPLNIDIDISGESKRFYRARVQ